MLGIAIQQHVYRSYAPTSTLGELMLLIVIVFI